MSNDVETDLMKQEIESLKKKLAVSEGKALAAARAQAQAERDREKAAEHAKVYREETDLMIANAGDQMRAAWSLGVGIWSLANWAGCTAARKDWALRLLHREDTYQKVLADFVAGSKSGNRGALETALRDAEKLVTIYKANSEKLHKERIALAVLQATTKSAETYAKLRAVFES